MSANEMQELLEAGVHFGHLTRRWNPKMKPYIYGARNGVHIIDLSKTVRLFREALNFILQVVGDGGDVLFVGTKNQAQDLIREYAEKSHMYYVNRRWLGGTLTNFRTIKTSINRLKSLQKKKDEGVFELLRKKERLMIDREITKLLDSLGGIQDMNKLPGVMIVVDSCMEHIAISEAKILGIPIVALADTNSDPTLIDFVVPGNDDAIKSIEIFLEKISNKILEGLQLREVNARRMGEADKSREDSKGGVREVEVSSQDKKASYVSRRAKEEEVEEVVEGQYSAKVNEVEENKKEEE